VKTPRRVATATAGDFTQATVYDELNRVMEEVYPFTRRTPGTTLGQGRRERRQRRQAHRDVHLQRQRRPLSRGHDGASATFAYDPRNLLASVTNAESTDPAPKVTRYNYTGRGQLFQETKANGNIVSHSYWADWLPRTTEEKKPDGTLVASHTLKYSANGDRTSDVASVQNADDHAAYLTTTTTTYTYDPRDRIAQVTKTPTGGTASVESYVHDANDNVVSQTVKGVATPGDEDLPVRARPGVADRDRRGRGEDRRVLRLQPAHRRGDADRHLG